MSKHRMLIENPQLMKEWDYEKNGLKPEELTAWSMKKVWWKCNNGHSWEAVIASRSGGNNCPYCGHRKVLAGFNDLKTRYPNIAKEWAYEKNDTLLPTQFMPQSEKKVWWKCEKGHYWKTYICNRIRGSNCPYCTGHFTLAGFNDLESQRPDLVKEWDWDKNSFLPSQVTVMSGKNAWWICAEGHSWQMSICARSKGSKCPYCNNQKVLKGFNDLESQNPELVKQWDYEKNSILPTQILHGSRKSVWWKCEQRHSWQARVNDRDRSSKSHCPYCLGKCVLKGFNDLETLNPKLAEQWDTDKNELLPSQVTLWSGKKVWWKCDKGHSWNTSLSVRSRGRNCPYCMSRSLLPGFNDLQTCRPDIAKEWDFEKNTLIPTQVFVGSNTSIWWKCSLGHSWESDVCDRTSGGNGCPYCAGKKVLAGFNDLKMLKPQLAAEWDHEKNELLPSQVTLFSQKLIWWKCKLGHSWKATVAARSRGDGCPYCSGKKVLKGFNDLETLNPKFLKEWDYEKNILLPSEVTRCSGKMVWWKCELGHSWKIKVSSRANGSGCPYCCNQKILPGFNDLQTLNPEVAREWDYEKNKLKPYQVAVSTNKPAWWKCGKEHSWKAPIAARTNGGTGCPYCSGRSVLPGFNDLQTINPKLAEEWDYDKNDLTPSEVTVASSQLMWWKCSKEHSWRAVVASRSSAGNGCPYCGGKRVQVGFNDLNTHCPQLADEWDYEKNEIAPTQVTVGSSQSIWWKCSRGHSWRATVASRSIAGSNCPICKGRVPYIPRCVN